MQLTTRVRSDVASVLHHRRAAAPGSEELLQAAEELGMVLEPVHPNAEDPHLAPYFTVEVSDPATACYEPEEVLFWRTTPRHRGTKRTAQPERKDLQQSAS